MERTSCIQTIENRLSEEDKKILKGIYEPKVLVAPLEDSRRSICVMADGEIRTYGFVDQTAENPLGVSAYYASIDGGSSWKLHYNYGKMTSATYFPEAKIYIGLKESEEDRTSVYISSVGPGDPNPREVKAADFPTFDGFLPLKSLYSNRIYFTAQECIENNGGHYACFFYSDDFGETWECVKIHSSPPMPVTYPDQGARWTNCGIEPCAAELDEKTMVMLLRNGYDAFEVTYSYDGGEHWTEPEFSTFYGHATTPFILRLSDGRILTFWNNTAILPELDHSTQIPPQNEDIINGVWEDAFTNRDVSHVAVSEDNGKTWMGYRELYLNPYRNHVDFRTVGAQHGWTDKSVHQFQAVELPYHKILVSVGQSPAVRRILIFDIDWLYENTRTEDFKRGLQNVTTHQYLKSISGGGTSDAYGHCSWNRISGAVIAPDPDRPGKECAQISHIKDDRLLTDIQGLCWNFPMSKKGCIAAEIKIAAGKLRVFISDRWYNPSDDTAHIFAPFSFELTAEDFAKEFFTLKLSYNLEEGFMKVFANEKELLILPQRKEVPTGISYLTLQCIAADHCEGTYIRRLEKQ